MAGDEPVPVVVLPKKNSGTISLQLGLGNGITHTEAKKPTGPVVVGNGNQVQLPAGRGGLG
ncbi:hypothetical protein B0919_17610 [Hymenobacter sp. CRA2]|nr:hypothetical protein B0919_17610 [Hymenobacter sp. CRA2]